MYDDLVGLRFTRVKYGRQRWVKRIKHVFFETCPEDGYRSVKVLILAEDGEQYYLDEIGLI